MTLPSSRRCLPMLLLALIAAACGGDGDPTGPEPVASVDATAPQTTLMVGQTTQLSVTLRDAAGVTLSGRTITYTSSSEGVATVSAAGLITAVGPGTTTITATSEGRSDAVQITVQAGSAPTVSAISPATLQAGQTATITGTNFSTSPSANIVTIGGERATVTAATATSLTISIPAGLCLPSGSVPVVVRIGSLASAPLQHAVQGSGTALTLPIGEMTLIQNAADLCLRFGGAAANESYSFGVQSTASSPGTLTDVVVGSNAGGAVAAVASPLAARQVPTGLSGMLLRERLTSPDARRWAAHRAAERKLREADRMLLPLARAVAAEQRGTPGALQAARAAAAIPSNVSVGDTVSIRVPDLESVCSGFTEIRTVVRVVGQRGVWLDDIENPAGGFELADFEQLSERFDNQIYQTNVEWFGPPTDRDQNSRVVIVATKEVNKQGDQPPLGFVTSADIVPRTQCASSDFGEIYYGRSADPAGEFGPVYPDSTARQDAVQLISHEFTHIIQFGRRIDNPQATSFPSDWELEGQATLAEEVNGHAATGRTNRQNYGYEVAWTGFLDNTIPSPFAWYADAFFDLIIYFGLNFDGNAFFKTAGAPEECSWLGRDDDGNDGPCVEGREVYGVPWSFLRFLTDHYAQAVGGGPAFHRALINGTGAGFNNLSNALNGSVPITEALARWSASLWVDDRFTGMEETITFPSWNLIDIIDEGLIEAAHLQPRARTFSTFADSVRVRGGSTAYFTISGGNRPSTFVRFRAADGSPLPAHMQVWVVRTR